MSASPSPIVSTTCGKIQGQWQNQDQIAVFKGIPFARPPLGELRWSPPVPAEKWEGIRPATKFAPFAWQRGTDIHKFIDNLVNGQGWGFWRTFFIKSLLKVVPMPRQSEDCLYLNVRTPAPGPQAKLPVMVWIHGGDHQDGSAAEPFYDSNALPQREVVTVSINYRLGLMGYLAHPELTATSEQGVSGNYGTLDQIAALQWVQENIAAFGGDPANVTIFGESAGGESVAHLLCSPLARGLFHKAIMQSPANSGQMYHLFHPFIDYPSGEELGVAFAQKAGISGSKQLQQLRAMPARKLYQVLRKELLLGNFYPLIDGYVLPQSPLQAFHEGRQANVPLLLGSNRDEGSIIHPLFPTPLIEFRYRDMPADRLPDYMQQEFGADLPRLLELYPGIASREPRAESALLGESMFGHRVRFYAEEATKNGQAVYLYMFTRVPPSPRQTIGAFHAAELPFVHGKNTPVLPLSKQDLALSASMMDYWTHFAKTGTPNDGRQPEWTAFSPETPRWMVLDTGSVGMQQVDLEEQYAIFTRRTLRQIDALKQVQSEKVS